MDLIRLYGHFLFVLIIVRLTAFAFEQGNTDCSGDWWWLGIPAVWDPGDTSSVISEFYQYLKSWVNDVQLDYTRCESEEWADYEQAAFAAIEKEQERYVARWGITEFYQLVVRVITEPVLGLSLLGFVVCIAALVLALHRGFRWLCSHEEKHFVTAVPRAIASRYEVLTLIGTCDNFNRFQMVSKTTNQHVFGKCLRDTSTPSARKEFDKEYQAIGALDHPNIINMLDWIHTGTTCCLALEYSSYGDLKTVMTTTAANLGIIDRLWVFGGLGFSRYGDLKTAMTIAANNFRFTDKLSVFRALGYSSIDDLKTAINITASNLWFADRLSVFRQIVSAVQYLHQAGWAHLNIRPESVLVFQPWMLVKLSGFSRVLQIDEKENLSNQFDLNQMCSSREVKRKQPYHAFKADVWALGSFFFYLLTGGCVHLDSEVPLNSLISSWNTDSTLPAMGRFQSLLTDLLSSEPSQRPDLSVVREILMHLE